MYKCKSFEDNRLMWDSKNDQAIPHRLTIAGCVRLFYIRRMKQLLIFLVTLMLGWLGARAGTIRGRVSEPGTGEALAGVSVEIAGLHRVALSGLDGSYVFQRI